MPRYRIKGRRKTEVFLHTAEQIAGRRKRNRRTKRAQQRVRAGGAVSKTTTRRKKRRALPVKPSKKALRYASTRPVAQTALEETCVPTAVL
jgi:hypothetical protein